jgi:FdrA protein
VTQDLSTLLSGQLKVINVGLSLFAESLRQQGVTVVEVDWRPPAGGDMELLGLLDKLGQSDPGEDAR